MTHRAMTTLLLATLLAVGRPVAAELLLLDEDFAPFTGTGLAPVAAGALDSRNWAVLGLSDGDSAFGDTRLDGDFARGTSPGGERGGGLYAFDLPGARRGLGVQATGSDFTPGALLRRVDNTTGVALSGLLVLFDLWVLNDGDRSTRLLFDVHEDAALTAGRRDESATRTTPASADTRGWQPLSVQAQFLDLTIPESGEFILRWLFDDAGGSGSRDEVALSRVRIQGLTSQDPSPQPPRAPTPTVALPGTFSLALAAFALALTWRWPAVVTPLPIGNAAAMPRTGSRS